MSGNDQYPPLPKYPASSTPAGYPSYPAPDPRAAPPPSTTRALWSLVLCCIPGVITILIGVVMAITVLVDSARDGRDHGRKLAISALCVAGFWLVVGIVVMIYVLTGRAERDETGEVTEAGRVQVVDLTEGDCLEDRPEVDKKRVFVEVVPCSGPHLGEVFATFDLEEWTSYDEIGPVVEQECLDRFDALQADSTVQPELSLLYFTPTDYSSFTDDPGVSCLALAAEPFTGSLRGSSN